MIACRLFFVRVQASALSSLIVDDARVAEERTKYRDAEARLFQASSPRRGLLHHTVRCSSASVGGKSSFVLIGFLAAVCAL